MKGGSSYGSDSDVVAESSAGEAEAGNEFGAEEYEGLSLQLHQPPRKESTYAGAGGFDGALYPRFKFRT